MYPDCEGNMIQQIPRLSLLLALVVVTGCGAYSDSGKYLTERSAPMPVPVPLKAVESVQMNTFYEASGTVRAKSNTVIQSKATGHIIRMAVNEGDRVSKDTVLLEIDDREALAWVQQATSALKAAREARGEVQAATLAAAHAQDAADANNALASATYDRYKRLRDQDVVSEQAYDEASAKWKSAAAESARAAETVASIQARSGEAEARIQQAEAALVNAQTLLSHTKVLAPFDGVVTKKHADVGTLAAPGSPLLELDATGQFQLEALVDESMIAMVHQGDTLQITVDAIADRTLQGVVSEVVPSASESSRTFVVRIDIQTVEPIISGMFGRARFITGQKETIQVPASAIVRRGQLASVYVVDESLVARMRLVTLGKANGDTVEILSGLDAGERIVVDGIDRVRDGCRIEAN
ncbi:MAG: hypothetical protein AMXMBFR84_13350 [Candidatus Hydrogenedentota bacterium]